MFSSLAESHPATRQTVPDFEFQLSLIQLFTWESEGCTFSFQRLKESHVAKPEIKFRMIQNIFEIIFLLLLNERQEQAQILI